MIQPLPTGMTQARWTEICEREIKTLKDRCHADETRLTELLDERDRLRALLARAAHECRHTITGKFLSEDIRAALAAK